MVVLVVATAIDRWMLAMPPVVAYVAIWAGLGCPLRWRRDLSYGVYIYAFPIGIGVAAAGGATAGVLPFVFATLALTIPVALLSWTFVERPALAFKHGVPLPTGMSLPHLRDWVAELAAIVGSARQAASAGMGHPEPRIRAAD